MERLLQKLREYFLMKFYGVIEIHFKAGKVTAFKETKSVDANEFN